MSITGKKSVVVIIIVLSICALYPLYYKFFWHFPRSRMYETRMITAIDNLIEKGDTLATFRIDSVMNFNWSKVIQIGPYLDVPEKTKNCGIDFSVLRNTALNSDDHYRGLLFLDKQNRPIKFLQFESMLFGFELINRNYPCGANKDEAVFRLRRSENEGGFFIRLTKLE